MATLVLIPGAWHGSWCWSEVVPLLEAAGHRVLTPDLIDAGTSATARERPLAVWADQIAALLRAEPEPVVLVGHSRGGLIISEVAERIPQKVRLLVYLAAFLLRNGETLQNVAHQADNAASFGAAVSFADGWLSFRDDDVWRLLYQRTPDRLVGTAREQLAPEPASAFTAPVHVTDERFGTVPRAYIECTEDRAIPLAAQRQMQAALPCATTIQLNSDHSPFFSMPAALAEVLVSCASGMATFPASGS